MLRISLQTLRARRGSLAGAFVAIFLAVTLAYATGLLMAGALSAPGPGRLAAADAVVRADPDRDRRQASDPERVDVVPAPAAAGRRPSPAPRRSPASPPPSATSSFAVGACDATARRLHGTGRDRCRAMAGRAPRSRRTA